MKRLQERLRTSLWPIPLVMLVAAVVLVELARAVDVRLAGSEAEAIWWLHSGTGDDARNLLSTLASAIMTIASVVFSITIVALSLAANHFGTRLVRTYVTDTRTKLSLGFFLLTVVYCLLALRLVSEDMAPADVPHVTVTAGLVLSVACVLVLVFFLHVVARSIVADEVIRRVAEELDESIDALPAAGTRAVPPPQPAGLLPDGFDAGSVVLRCDEEGYVQEIRYEQLARCATREDVVVRVDVSAGDYMCKQGWAGRVHPDERCSERLLAQLGRSLVLGPERTPVQDLGYAVRHLVDVALRALSLGINDPNTALVVIDRLRGALARLLGRSLPSGVFLDDSGRCRVLGIRRSHAEIIAEALGPIRDAASPQPLVIVAMLEALTKLCEHAREPAHLDAIGEEARRIAEAGLLKARLEDEQHAIRHALQAVRDKLRVVGQAPQPDRAG